MNNLYLKRVAYRPTYTIGKLYLNGRYFCDTLEDKYRGDNLEKTKVKGKTAIPRGTYRGIFNYSPKFKKYLPLLMDVPYFTGIRIHSGNTAEDTEGCILVGENLEVGKVLNSRVTYNRLASALANKEFKITIV